MGAGGFYPRHQRPPVWIGKLMREVLEMFLEAKFPAGASVLLTNVQRRTKFNNRDEYETDKEGRAVWRATLSLRGEGDAFPQSLAVNVHTNDDLTNLGAGTVRAMPGLSAVLYNDSKGRVMTSYRCDGIEVEDVEELAKKARAYDQMLARQKAQTASADTAPAQETKRRVRLRS